MCFRVMFLCRRLALLLLDSRSLCSGGSGRLLLLFALLLGESCRVGFSQLTRCFGGDLSQVLDDDFACAVDRLLRCLGDFRLRMRRHRLPAQLQLLQGRREQRIEVSMAVSFHGRGHCSDFRMQVLDFALLRQQNIALARQDFVNALVFAAARIPDQLPDLRRIVDGLCGLLPELGRGTLDDQLGHCLRIPSSNRCFQGLLLLRGEHGRVRSARDGRFCSDGFRWLFRSCRRWRLFKAREQRHRSILGLILRQTGTLTHPVIGKR
jgi:hypothetical protein